jgi:hypothetical protein
MKEMANILPIKERKEVTEKKIRCLKYRGFVTYIPSAIK